MRWISFLLLAFSLQSFAQTQFVVIGDSGKDNDGQKRVADALLRHCTVERCDYGVLTGDNIYPVGMNSWDDPVLDRMFLKYYGPLQFPFFISLGNHDYGKFAFDWKRGNYQKAYSLKNPQYYLPHFYYYHEFTDLVLVVLDTSRLMWNKEAKQQELMLKEAYSKAQGKWVIVVAHHPYLSNGKHGNAGRYEDVPILPSFVSGKYVKRFVDRNICGRAQLYLSGHDHNLQLIDGRIKNCNTMFAVSGAGASITKLKRRNPAVFQSEELGFIALTAAKEALTLRFFDSENRQTHIETIRK